MQTTIEWLEQGYQVELVTLIKCWGSAPRPPGSMAAVRSDGIIVGSVSGGCIEKELSQLLRQPGETQLVQHDVTGEQAMRYGLPSGGSLELVFEQFNDMDHIKEIIQALDRRQRICRRVELETGTVTLMQVDRDQEFHYGGKYFNKVFGPAWRLLLIGAGELSRYVAEIALALDYEVIVCEPRTHFSRAWNVAAVNVDERSPDEAVASLSSDSRSAVLALTHDPNLDDLALVEALSSEVFYVGALGSRKNNDKRRHRLVNAFGLDSSRVDSLHGPIGLNIGSRTPAEIAVVIVAEITALRYNATSNIYPRI